MISPADFDVIISDEAHRSIYNKWRDVFTYLDAIQIGLTATPSELVEKDTFRFFNCPDGAPTALYDYEEAVREGFFAISGGTSSALRHISRLQGLGRRI